MRGDSAAAPDPDRGFSLFVMGGGSTLERRDGVTVRAGAGWRWAPAWIFEVEFTRVPRRLETIRVVTAGLDFEGSGERRLYVGGRTGAFRLRETGMWLEAHAGLRWYLAPAWGVRLEGAGQLVREFGELPGVGAHFLAGLFFRL